MEQFEVVFKPVEGYEHVAIKSKNGELIVRLVPNSSEKLQKNTTCSKNETAVKSSDKANFFTKITAEDREKVKEWLATKSSKTDRDKTFLERVRKAVKEVNYDYWIANIEPSVAKGKICYAKGKKVGVGFSCNQYKQMAEDYAPDRGSRLAKLHELFIWYALRIVDGFWTLDYVANNSSRIGNSRKAPGATYSMEKTGERKCGGFCDGQGNTYKIVTVEDGYALVGGFKNDGYGYPVADVQYYYRPYFTLNCSSGVLVLTK